MKRKTFLSLPTEEVAALMRATGPKVCVFPINGTRRWYMLEHAGYADLGLDYVEVIARRHVEIYRLFMEHGIDTLLAPSFGSELMTRGPAYLQLAVEGLTQLATHSIFTEFYRECGVRVRFYGDYRKQLNTAPYTHLTDLFDRVVAETAHYGPHRLFFGVCANDATETVAELGVRYFQQHGLVPDRRALVTMYYGEYIEPVSLFIGFGELGAFDMPLLALGEEDLYFTISPSLYMTERQLRAILYDYLFARHAPDPDYASMSAEARTRMREFYQRHLDTILGLGTLEDGIWYPRTFD
jgi:hypothetical protein